MSVQPRSTVFLCLVLFCAAFSGCQRSPEAREARFLKRGQALVSQKDYARALLEFRNAANAMPKDAEPYYQMGLAYIETGDGPSALRAFQRAVALNPKHAGAQLNMAKFMTASRDENMVQEAVNRLHSVFGDSPENPEAINTLAIAEWELGKPEAASRRLEEALQKFPTNLQSSVTLARMKLAAKDPDGAEAVLRKAAADAPQSSLVELALGELYVSLRQQAKAETEFKKAVQLDPKNGAALRNLGALQYEAKRMDEAEQTFKQLAALPEKPYKPLHAIFLYQIGKRDAALAEFEALVKAAPTDREARTRLVTAQIGMNRIADAETLLAAVLKNNPKDADALLQRGELRLRAGKTDDAEKDLKTVIHFNQDSAAAHFMLARTYQAKGMLSNQQEELQQVLRLNPGMLQARWALAMSFLGINQSKAALDIMDQAPEVQKTESRWILGRNWTLLAMGSTQDVKPSIDRVLAQGRVPEAVFQNAVFRLLQKDYAGARASLDELVQRGITDVNVTDLLMQTYVAQKDSAKGLERLKELAAAQPKSPGLQWTLGQWYLRNGKMPDARKAFENAKAADARFTAADLSLADLDLREGQNGPAKQKLGTVISANPKNVGARMLMARAEGESGNHAAEIESYRAILSLEPSNLIALNNLAYGLAANSPDEALKFAQQAAEKAPDEPGIQDTLGWIYYRKGLYSVAVRYLKTSVEKGPNPRRQFHLGMSYLKMGDQAAGQKLVREALQKDPNLAKTEQGW